MSTLAQRIQEVIDAGFSQVELARAAGVTKGATNQWLNGGIKSLKLEYAEGIEVLTGFSAAWLVTGKGEKRADASSSSITAIPGARPVRVIGDDEDHPELVKIRKVKLRLSAGIAGFAVDEEIEDDSPINFPRSWLERRGFSRENLIALPVKGQSMEPGLYDGDTVVVNTADTKPKDGEVFAVNYEGEAVIKRMVRDFGYWFLVSDNPDQRRYPKKQCANDMCIVIGKVVHKQSDHI